jgi:hypothetical protein
MGSADEWADKIPVQNQDVAWRVVDEECIIIHPETSQATVLNTVGARIWELADGKLTAGQIVDALEAEYDVQRDVVERDAREFLNDLAGRKILELRDKS